MPAEPTTRSLLVNGQTTMPLGGSIHVFTNEAAGEASAVIKDADGKPIGVVITARDVEITPHRPDR